MSRIIVAVNKTLPRNGKAELDTGQFYLFEPLLELGHQVYFFDTVSPINPDFDEAVNILEPDLIWCCFTGNPYITPFEPWDSIQRLTKEGKVKTFNWFCDDTWRFNDFSSKACHLFNYCSTPEPRYIEKFKDIGYNNILLGGWCPNSNYYPNNEYDEKDIELSFVGGMNKDREDFFSRIDIPVTTAGNLDIKDLFKFYCRSKIGVNLSINANDPEKKTQMKQRIFELAAANCTVLTEYHESVEEFFNIDTEIVTFKNTDEFEEKVKYLQANPKKAKEIANNGRKRFLKDHESKVRLKNILDVIL
tara:strand:- start:956 stop:1867 length:912 start_codon:yes stop_codon:yes gene_type:complete